MATGISNFSLTSSGNNINFSFTWEGFTCATSPEIIIRLIDNTTFVVAAAYLYNSGIQTTGTITGTFFNIYVGTFYGTILFKCNNLVVSVYDSSVISHGGTISPPPAPPAPPTSGPTGIGSNNINADGNLNFCIGTLENDVKFSKLNQIFGRALNTPNSLLSGTQNPSQPPSLFGFSYLPLNVINPGKLRFNAISELRGTCNYVAPNLYKVTIEVGNEFLDSNLHVILPYKVIWVHEPSGNITDRCPFNSSRVEVYTWIRTENGYTGSTTPSPYRVRVTKFTNSTNTESSEDTTRSVTTLGITQINRQVTLSYRDMCYGFIEAEALIIGSTSDFSIRLQVDIANTTYHQLSSIAIPIISNVRTVFINRPTLPSGNFSYTWSNNVSGAGAINSTLAASSTFSDTTTSSNSGGANSSATGNRTVSITPSPTSLYTTLIVEENNNIIYNNTQIGTQSVTINFLSGNIYYIYGLSTTAIQ